MVHPNEKAALAKAMRSQRECPRCGAPAHRGHRIASVPHDTVSLKQCPECGLVYPNPQDERAYEKIDGEWQYIGAKKEHQQYHQQYANEDYGEFGSF